MALCARCTAACARSPAFISVGVSGMDGGDVSDWIWARRGGLAGSNLALSVSKLSAFEAVPNWSLKQSAIYQWLNQALWDLTIDSSSSEISTQQSCKFVIL